MHIPQSMLSGAVCPVTIVLGTVGVASAAAVASRSKNKPAASLFFAVTAFLFAAQMLNFPIQNGTSGHLLGGVLAASLIGIPFGILAMSLVVTLQALILSDGGINALGANIFNIALLGVGLGGGLRLVILKCGGRKISEPVATAVAAWASVILSATACSLELALSGVRPLTTILTAMLSIHAWIGLGEGVITVFLIEVFVYAPNYIPRCTLTRAVLVAVIFLGLLIPFSSPWPDGLESALYASLRI